MSFESGAAPPAPPSPDALVFAFLNDALLVRPAGEAFVLEPVASPETLGIPADRALYVGRLDGRDCWAARLDAAPEGLVPKGLRSLFPSFGEELWSVAGRAAQLLLFDETHRFCGRCATPTERVAGEHARKCPNCGLSAYPRVSPAIIVLVRRGAEALLARGARFPAAFYSTLAGFVEPGESLEQAVAREVHEEAGVRVDDVRYFGSQPWPFPHSLMVGFTARWAGGELRADGVEILDAQWWSADRLPAIPPRPSIARRLIDAWVEDARNAR